jgi:ABC-2 type transport system permease protein
VSEINQQFAVVDAVNQALAGKNIPPAQITVVATQFLAQERQSPLVTVKDVSIGVQPNTVKEFLPGIVTMYVLFAISIAAAAIVDERRKGTLERLITTRLTIGELFLGKFMANVFRGFIQTFILLVLSYAVFQIFTPLTFVASLFIALLFATACSAIGLLLASLVKTPDSATWIGVFITMGMTMLGGTFFAIEKGSALYPFSKLSINGYANTAFKTLINGGGISTLGVEISVLVGVTIVALILSRLMFKAVPQGK